VHGAHVRPSSEPRDYEPPARIQLVEDRTGMATANLIRLQRVQSVKIGRN
jgi:hypothetical protein